MKSILKLYPSSRKHSNKNEVKMEPNARKESRIKNENYDIELNNNDNNNNMNNSNNKDNLSNDRKVLGHVNPGYEGDNDDRGGFPNTPPVYEREESYEDEQEEFIRVPSCMLGKPLKDFHSGQDNTFVAVGIKLGKQQVFRFSMAKAMYILGPENAIRRCGIFILTHQYFEIGILLTIITNCIFMALSMEEGSKTAEISEIVFAVIYTFEMTVKIIARGFILHKYSYLRNAWNWLDFFVVIIGYITMSPSINQLSFFKTFRVLRALKTISTVKGLKAMVDTLMKSMKMMTDVMILTVFFIAVFALIGLQLFIGEFHNRCVKNTTVDGSHVYFKTEYDFEVVCGNSSMAWNCPEDYVCLQTNEGNPEEGYISYDDFLYSFLTTLQVVTLDSWEKVYNYGLAVKGAPIMFYFLLVVLLGPFYLLNLVLAIVSASYEMEIHECPEEELELEAMHRRSASTYTFNGDSFVEFLTGPSPLDIVNGEKRYTVSEPPPKKKKKESENVTEVFVGPVLGDNPSIGLRIQVVFYNFAKSSLFEFFIIFCIMINTCIMASEHSDMTQFQKDLSSYANYVFTAVFFVEMLIKMIAYTPAIYIKNKWNCFDGTLVILSIVDILVVMLNSGGGSVSSLKMLKVFRLLRVLKLAQSWKTMGQLLSTIASSLGALGNVSIILLLIIYIFSVAGMQLFEEFTPDKTDKNGHFYPIIERWNFSNFGNSFMMIFRILCGKWIEPQWALLKEYSAATLIFVLVVFVIGRWVVLNLFLALLLSSFGGDAFASDEEEVEKKPKVSRIKRIIRWIKKKRLKKEGRVHSADVRNAAYANNGSTNQMVPDDHSDVVLTGSDIPLKHKPNSAESIQLSLPTEGSSVILDQELANEKEKKREKTYVEDCFCGFCYTCGCFYSSYLDSPTRRLWHNARFYCSEFVEHKAFEAVILFLITFSSITLVFEDVHLKTKPDLIKFLNYCNHFFAIIFTMEFLIKLFAMGFLKYFTNFWNILDVFIVCISLITLLMGDDGGNLGFLRSLRGLRPLRAISRFAGMKVVVNALVHSIPSIGNVLLVGIMFWFLFAIMGFNMFGGTFGRCNGPDGKRLNRSVVMNKSQCDNFTNSNKSYKWVNPNINFDNSINGVLALFETATLEGWFEVQYDAQDSDSDQKNNQPEINQNQWLAAAFIIFFIVIGSFFILNLFIGVIIDNFNRLTQQYEDGVGIFLTPSQRNWVNTLKAASLRRPSRRIIRPKSKWRAKLFDFIHKKYFEFFIMCMILLNMISMMMNHHNAPEAVTRAITYLNYVFTTIFTLEAIVRLIAMRLEYFKSGMNVFDFVTVIFSIAVIVMTLAEQEFPISPGLFRVIRVLRLGRLLRFFQGAKGIRKLLFTIIKSAPALKNIGTLIALILFIYAIIGMNLFQDLKDSDVITPVSNFKTWFQSFCLLFRIATAASWNYVLEAAMKDKEIPKLLSIIYFVSYMIIINLIIINMYIAVILENFNQAQSQDEAGITEDDLEQYYVVWEEFDPKATQFIKYSQLPDFIDALEPPLRVPAPNYYFLEKVNIPIKEKHYCHCLDVMTALIKRALGDSCGEVDDSEDLTSVINKLESKFKVIFPRRTKEQTVETTKARLLTENSAARVIQCVFRRNLLFEGIRIILTSRNMSLRAREKNLSTVERLITNLWKRREEYPATEDGEEGDEEDDLDEDAKPIEENATQV